MFEKQNADVPITFTGFDYRCVAAILRPTSQPNQLQPGQGGRSAKNYLSSDDERSERSGPVGALNANPCEQPARDALLASTASILAPRQDTKRRQIDLNQPGFLRLADVLAIFPVSRAAWYAGTKSGIYPPSVSIGPRSVGWPTSSIKKLMEALAAAQTPQGARPKMRGDVAT